MADQQDRGAKDIPIIFSAPMVRALLDGRKTQTRRLLKPQPPKPEDFPGSVFGLSRAVADGVKMYSLNDHDRLPKHPTKWDLVGSVGRARDAGFPLAYDTRYAVGDRLWVRENWQRTEAYQGPSVSYAADESVYAVLYRDPDAPFGTAYGVGEKLDDVHDGPWRPSIHMPRWASRLTLVVEGVKVERLQDISEADAKAEGTEPGDGMCDHIRHTCEEVGCDGGNHRGAFRVLWGELHGADAWDANPWVVALTFRVIRSNIDALSREPAKADTPSRQAQGAILKTAAM